MVRCPGSVRGQGGGEGRAPVGFFGGFVFDGRGWHAFDLDSVPALTAAGPRLSVYIHDSDIAWIRYQPAGPGSGNAYLGYTPKTYAQDKSSQTSTDVLREASGLAFWVARQRGGSDEAGLRDLILPFLAADAQEPQPGTDAGTEDDGDLDMFVEVKVAKFLAAIGLPVPDGLPGT